MKLTNEQNARRAHLLAKELEGVISHVEVRELDKLQEQMLEYRNEVAPLVPPLQGILGIDSKQINQAAFEIAETARAAHIVLASLVKRGIVITLFGRDIPIKLGPEQPKETP